MKPIFNTLEFDGINSLEQGVFITGESVYNAPERDVESVEIAGRSGDYLIDKGRWKNIDVKYTCGCFGEDQDEFAKKIRKFRNLLASRYGYHRLVDSYNPEEYRLGVFKNPVEVNSQSMKRAGEFDLVFNCNPKRYLMSGDSEMTVTDGEEIFNPTPFDSSPLLAVKGYGTIRMGDSTIVLENATLGNINIDSNRMWSQTDTVKESWTYDTGSFNVGDTVTMSGLKVSCKLAVNGAGASFAATPTLEYHEDSQDTDASLSCTVSGKTAIYTISVPNITFTVGEDKHIDYYLRATASITSPNRTRSTSTLTHQRIDYVDGQISVSLESEFGIRYTTQFFSYANVSVGTTYEISDISGESTLNLLGDPTYIDCDLGDAYLINNGAYVSLNEYIDLGSDMPKLVSGNNAIVLDDTVTELKITPRWWIL